MTAHNLKRDKSLYRKNVGIAVFNDKGQIWLGKRFGETGKHTWQCPQGGMDKGETPKTAAIRELYEETGLRAKKMTYLGKIDEWLYYDFPPELISKKRQKYGHVGQRQKWYAWRYDGDGSDVDLKSHGPQEFSKWKWVELETIKETIVPFKRDVYARLVSDFAPFAKPVK